MSTARGTIFTNARLFVGDGRGAIPDGAVWVDGKSVSWCGRAGDLHGQARKADHEVDCRGMFVMPGLVEAHAHLSYQGLAGEDLKRSPDETLIGAMNNARLMLRMGYTSAYSFGSRYNTDIRLRDAINRGEIPGPRYLAAMAVERDQVMGPQEVRLAVQKIRSEGADVVKIYLDGENMTPHNRVGDISFSWEEVMACGEESRAQGMRLVTHSRSAAAVKMALAARAEVIAHANYVDSEVLTMMRESDRALYVTPAIAFAVGAYENGKAFGLDPSVLDAMGYGAEIEITRESVRRMREVGVRLLPGGDYGFGWTPHGTYAKDLQYFVDLFGYTPVDALTAATRDAGEVMGFQGCVGTLQPGKFADLLIVDGDPTSDITVLQRSERIVAIMKAGQLYHNELDIH